MSKVGNSPKISFSRPRDGGGTILLYLAGSADSRSVNLDVSTIFLFSRWLRESELRMPAMMSTCRGTRCRGSQGFLPSVSPVQNDENESGLGRYEIVRRPIEIPIPPTLSIPPVGRIFLHN